MLPHFASNLKRLREVRRASQDVVSNALGIKRSTYSGYENGAAEPSLSLLVDIAIYFRVTTDELLTYHLSDWATSEIERLQRSQQSAEPCPPRSPSTRA